MADRLTQLQDAVNSQAELICNSVGIIQQYATPSSFPEFEKSASKSGSQAIDGYIEYFAQQIAKNAKDIDTLIDSLPCEDSPPELQAANLRRLEQENQDAARKLEEVVHKGELLLEQIQKALHDIAESQLKIQRLQDGSS